MVAYKLQKRILLLTDKKSLEDMKDMQICLGV